MQSGETSAGDLTRREKILLAEYAEVCTSHAGITDFRAKLLALLPIASGAGIALLIARGSGRVSRTEAGLLIALGIFGAVVTAGLFLYELRQIDLCKQMRNHASWIEKQLGIDAGQFGGRRPRLSLREIYSPSTHRLREDALTAIEKEGEPTPTSEPEHSLLRGCWWLRSGSQSWPDKQSWPDEARTDTFQRTRSAHRVRRRRDRHASVPATGRDHGLPARLRAS